MYIQQFFYLFLGANINAKNENPQINAILLEIVSFLCRHCRRCNNLFLFSSLLE